MSAIIYLITNTLNNKQYVGKTILGLDARWSSHRASANGGSSYYFHRAIRKYGPDVFDCEVLEEATDDTLDDRERYWIAELKPAYNMTSGGEGGDYWRGKEFSVEHRRKLSDALRRRKRSPMSEEQKEKLRKVNLGKKASVETKIKMSKKRKGVPHSPEHTAKLIPHLREANERRRQLAKRKSGVSQIDSLRQDAKSDSN